MFLFKYLLILPFYQVQPECFSLINIKKNLVFVSNFTSIAVDKKCSLGKKQFTSCNSLSQKGLTNDLFIVFFLGGGGGGNTFFSF